MFVRLHELHLLTFVRFTEIWPRGLVLLLDGLGSRENVLPDKMLNNVAFTATAIEKMSILIFNQKFNKLKLIRYWVNWVNNLYALFDYYVKIA